MPRLPYEQIAPEANKFLNKMLLAKNDAAVKYWWDMYVSLLEGAGWSVLEFEQEENKRVDETWDRDKPPIWN